MAGTVCDIIINIVMAGTRDIELSFQGICVRDDTALLEGKPYMVIQSTLEG